MHCGTLREWGDDGKTQRPLTLLLSDSRCGCAVRLWVTKGIVDSWTQGANIWAGADSTKGYRKGQNRAATHTNECHERAKYHCLPLRFCPSWSLICWGVANVLGRCLVILGVFFSLLPAEKFRAFLFNGLASQCSCSFSNSLSPQIFIYTSYVTEDKLLWNQACRHTYKHTLTERQILTETFLNVHALTHRLSNPNHKAQIRILTLVF